MLYPYHRRQPRQPETERGRVVYSTETPTHTSPITRAIMRREAEASVALDGETQSLAIANDTTKEEPVMSSKRGPNVMPYGRKRSDVMRGIGRYLDQNPTFDFGTDVITRNQIWGDGFTKSMRDYWMKAYGSEAEAKNRLAQGMRRLDVKLDILAAVEGKLMTYYIIDPGALAPHRASAVEVPTKMAAPTVDEVPERTHDFGAPPELPMPDGIMHLRHIGVSDDGEDLYLDPTSNVIGTITFLPIGKAR